MRIALVQEEQRRLRVPDIAADVAHGLVDVAVGDHEIELAVEIGIGEHAAEAETIERWVPDARASRDILIEPFLLWPIQPDHLVVEVGDGKSGSAGVVEVRGVDPHARPRLPVVAERDAGLERDVLEAAVALIAIELVRLRIVGDEESGQPS